MRQFDVHRSVAEGGPLLVIIQADVIQDLNVVVAAPLYRLSDWGSPARHLHPAFDIHGEKYVLLTNHLAAVPYQHIGHKEGSLADHRYDILAALDFLFTGI